MTDVSEEEKTELVIQFQQLTGIDSFDRCHTILSNHNWNIQTAFDNIFSEDNNLDPAFIAQEQSPLVNERILPLVVNFPSERIFYPPEIPTSWSSWLRWIAAIPFRFTLTTFWQIIRFTYRIFVPDPRYQITDPYGDVRNFIDNFENRYGYLHPNFLRMTYAQGLQKAKKDYQFLIIYLAENNNENCEEFNRNCLCNPDFSSFLNNQFLLWACNIDTPEGFRASNILHEYSYPSFTVVLLREHKMTVVARLRGLYNPSDLQKHLNLVVRANKMHLEMAKLNEQERINNQILRDQQDAAYSMSLKADQEKLKKKKEEEDRLLQIEVEKAARLQRQIEMKNDRKHRKISIREALPEEPDDLDSNAVKLIFKLPSGQRLERRFLASDNINHIKNYILSREEIPHKFEIIQPYPRNKLLTYLGDDLSDDGDFPTLRSSGLTKTETLFVQHLTDSEDEEELS